MESALAKLKKDIEKLEKSKSYKNEQALIKGVEKLLTKYGKSKAELIAFLGEGKSPKSSAEEEATKRTRKQRKLKIYKNPHTNESIETRGANHRVLKTWKAQYPTNEIEQWVIEER
jgi:hypothetical protein